MTIFDLRSKYHYLEEAAKRARQIGNKFEVEDELHATITGKVENVKFLERRNGVLYTYLIVDETGAFYAKQMVYNNKPVENYNLQPGTTVECALKLVINDFTIELEGWIEKAPVVIPTVVVKDDAKRKRIEFSLHTKMSSYDGLISVEKLVKRLHDDEQPYFAITDRSNVHIYPELAATDLKPIYGIEIEMLEDKIPAVLNGRQQKLRTGTYVVFDLETTGLYPAFEDIIEFGAVRYKNGVFLESKQFFLKPNHAISLNTQELTHIAPEDVENAVDQKTGIQQIVEFCGDDILVAHNGIEFDFSFLNYKLEEYGLRPMTNPIIDTMVISRAINQYISNTLGNISKKLGVEYSKSDAHRADYDADVLAKVWDKMINQLSDLGVTDLLEINGVLDQKNLKKNTRGYYVNLYVKSQKGIRDLYELVSIAHTSEYYGRPTLSRGTIERFRENLLVANSPIESEVLERMMSTHHPEPIAQFYDFLIVPPVDNFLPEIRMQTLSVLDVQDVIRRTIAIAKKIGILFVASGSVYYLTHEEQKYHDLLVNNPILNKRKHRFARAKTGPDGYLRTTREMLDEFRFLGDKELINDLVIENGYKILAKIVFPITPVQSQLFAPHIPGVDQKVRDMVYQTAHARYGQNLPEIVVKRVEKELHSIISNGYAVVYWISHLLVKKSNEDGYVVGSRGSVGSSLVATFLKITDVNPLPPHYLCRRCGYSNFIVPDDIDDGFDLKPIPCPKCETKMYGEGHNIPFETFLGFEGDKVPDIDLNFSGEYQWKAHQFIKEMFGEDHSFKAGTVATIADKTSLANAIQYDEKMDLNMSYADAEDYAVRCQDIKRTTGQHPGGIVIVPEDMSIYDFTPFNYPADDPTQWKTTHFPFEFIHNNLLKFDILGHDNPTSLKILKELTGVDEKDIPVYEPRVLKLFTDIRILGIDPKDIFNETTGAITLPEFGTHFVRRMLYDAKPKSFADLVRISGLSHGTNVWNGNAQELITKNGLTLANVIGCRDDIMTYLIKMGVEPLVSFKVMEDVRKGKGIKPDYEAKLLQSNVPGWYLTSANKIKYMFPKAHAIAYVMHAWKFAWFKLYYPREYYTTYLTVRSQSFDIKVATGTVGDVRQAILDIQKKKSDKSSELKAKDEWLAEIYEVILELKLRGFKIKKIDLNKSYSNRFRMDPDDPKAIICPFNTLEGLGESVADSIVEAARVKPFTSVEDLKARTKLTKKHIQFLQELNVLDGLAEKNQTSLFDFI